MEELHSSELEDYDFGAAGRAEGGSISISSQINTPKSSPAAKGMDKEPPKPRRDQDHHRKRGLEEQNEGQGVDEVDGDGTYAAASSISRRARQRPKPKQRTPATISSGRANAEAEEEDEEETKTKTKRTKKGTIEASGPPQRRQSSTTTATATTQSEDDRSMAMEVPAPAPRRYKGTGGGDDDSRHGHGHRQATKIEQVLRQLKEDVVPLNRNSREGKTKWKMMVENMQLGQGASSSFVRGAGDGGDTPHSHLRFEDETYPQQHQRVDKSQVGADIYSNRWKKMVSFQNQKPSKEPSSSPSGLEVNNNAEKFQAENAGQGEQAPRPLSHRVTFYFSGILAGLFLWSMLFAVSNVGGGGITALGQGHGSAFSTIHSLVTTGIMLIVVVGFISSVFTLQGSVADFERLLYHFLPVLLILICHYVSKAFELRSMECADYRQLGAESKAKVHESYKCTAEIVNGVDKGTGSVGFMFLHLLPWLAAMGIYTYLHIAPPATRRQAGRQ